MPTMPNGKQQRMVIRIDSTSQVLGLAGISVGGTGGGVYWFSILKYFIYKLIVLLFYSEIYADNTLPIPAKEPKNTTKTIMATIANTIAPMAIHNVIFVQRAAFADAS